MHCNYLANAQCSVQRSDLLQDINSQPARGRAAAAEHHQCQTLH